MKILVDTREQKPFAFADSPAYEGVVTEAQDLTTGDYSLFGLKDKVAVERKELPDLIQCLKDDTRERFERELLRGKALDAFLVVVEASFDDIVYHRYRSQMTPTSALQSLFAFMGRYRVSFLFAGSRRGAEYATFSFLRQYALEAQSRYKAIVKNFEEDSCSIQPRKSATKKSAKASASSASAESQATWLEPSTASTTPSEPRNASA